MVRTLHGEGVRIQAASFFQISIGDSFEVVVLLLGSSAS